MLGLLTPHQRSVRKIFGVPLPKRHAVAGRVSIYENYFYLLGFTRLSQGFETGHGAEEEETSGACWEAQHDNRKRDQSFPKACFQA